MPLRKKPATQSGRRTKKAAAKKPSSSANIKQSSSQAEPARRGRPARAKKVQPVEEVEEEEEDELDEDEAAEEQVEAPRGNQQAAAAAAAQESGSSEDEDEAALVEAQLVTSPVKPTASAPRRTPSKRQQQLREQREKAKAIVEDSDGTEEEDEEEEVRPRKKRSSSVRKAPSGPRKLRPDPKLGVPPRSTQVVPEEIHPPWDPSEDQPEANGEADDPQRFRVLYEDEDLNRADNPERPNQIFVHSMKGQWYHDRIFFYENLLEQEREQMEQAVEENGGKVVDTMKEADYVIIPRGDANMFREVITSARNYGALPVQQLWIPTCVEATEEKGKPWRLDPKTFTARLTVVGNDRKAFTREEKMYLARQILKLRKKKFSTPIVCCRQAMKKFPNTHPESSWHNLLKKSVEIPDMVKRIKRSRRRRGKKSLETNDEEASDLDEDADEDQLVSDGEEEEETYRKKPNGKKVQAPEPSDEEQHEQEVDQPAEEEAEEEEDLPSAKDVRPSKKRARESEGGAPSPKKVKLGSQTLPKSSGKSTKSSTLRASDSSSLRKQLDSSAAEGIPDSNKILPADLQPLADLYSPSQLSHRQLQGLFYYSSGNLSATTSAAEKFVSGQDDPWLWKPNEDQRIRERGKEVELEGREAKEVRGRAKWLKIMDQVMGKKARAELWHPELE